MAIRFAMFVSLLLVLAGVWAWWYFQPPEEFGPREIFHGIRYECRHLPPTDEGGGAVHLVEVDLSAPGIELYLTPLDRSAVENGYQYELTHASTVARQEGLSVAINAAMFTGGGWIPLAGEWAHGVETVVADGEVSHRHPHSYLLWFDRKGKPHLERDKPPGQEALGRARWGVGSQQIVLADGKVSKFAGRLPDRRTLVGVNRQANLLWLAAFAHASPQVGAQLLACCGATEAVLLDGGDSTQMYLKPFAAGIPSGTLIGGHRPVATVLGVRAVPIQPFGVSSLQPAGKVED